ncbi:class I histocompatibility antigen, F10 alpha chain-like isoform X2 [Apteryx rowi]|uniref:class I histocompatibility antigen, F10 alpha chain-like isoform X2 n=1 Tax=Apteryx rowi TaxID=308060 RepID=UPI000E1C6917|nr:class I histocompatibility antigen, F10 alpha chain-like isoform X2 [Apteryx rowi]
MADNLDQQYWDHKTERWYHTVQGMYGCDILENGGIQGFEQYAYDGRDFIALDKDTLTFTAADAGAEITKREREAAAEAERWKRYLETACIEELRKYVKYGKATLERRERPAVQVSGKESHGLLTLSCRAHGFYPRSIAIDWLRKGRVQAQETKRGSTAPNSDGTYHAWASIEALAAEKDEYQCRVEHASLLEPGLFSWEPESNLLPIVIGVVIAALIIVVVIASFVFWKSRSGRRENGYAPATGEYWGAAACQAGRSSGAGFGLWFLAAMGLAFPGPRLPLLLLSRACSFYPSPTAGVRVPVLPLEAEALGCCPLLLAAVRRLQGWVPAGGLCPSPALPTDSAGVSEPSPGLPAFVSVGYVDGETIMRYGSEQRAEPGAGWMKANLDQQYWDHQTEIAQVNQQTFRLNLDTLQKRYNQSGGYHTRQSMYGCDLLEDGGIRGFYQHAYDGRDFLALDKDALTFTAADAGAEITKGKWEAAAVPERMKYYLEKTCIEWLQKYVEYGKATLERRERPVVQVSGKESDGLLTLSCRAHGFYPRSIDINWLRKGRVQAQETKRGSTAPNSDGTYHAWASIEALAAEKDEYQCRVEHASLPEPGLYSWEPQSNLLPIIIGVVVAVLVVIAAIAGFVVWKSRSGMREKGYKPTAGECWGAAACQARRGSVSGF